MEHEGEQLVCIYDAEGYVDAQILLSPPAFFVATCLDGQQDETAIQGAFAAQFDGAHIEPEDIERIATMLEEQGFLYSPQFMAMIKARETTFKASPTRPAHLAGRSYPADPAELREMIDGFFTREGGPGALPVFGDGTQHPLRGLVVPHIDFERGGHTYAHGYGCLFSQPRPRTVLIFGVAHHAAPVPFILTRKNFETPLGTLKVNTTMVDALAEACSWDPYAYEDTHRCEHSIEFQAVMLAYGYGSDVEIVPILCSSLAMAEETGSPETQDEVAKFLDVCNALASNSEDRVTVLAAADLAHVGRCFGDDFEVDDERISGIAARDRTDLTMVEEMDAAGWYARVMKDSNARKVCGLGCIYATLKTLNGASHHADLLHYDYAHDPSGGIVSFASLAMK